MSSPAIANSLRPRAPQYRRGASRFSVAIRRNTRRILTAVVMPTGHDADHLRDLVLKHFDMSLGAGLSKLKGRVFRIGHLGHFNDLMLMGTLSGVEMALDLAKVPHQTGGVLAAMEVLKGNNASPVSAATKSAVAS